MPILILPGQRWARCVGFILLVLLLAVGLPLSAQPPISKEYQIKAVFLFNFAQFVSWPADSFTSQDEPFCIGVLGDDPFGAFLDETVRGENIDGHPLVVQRYARVEDVKDCRILFISESEKKDIKNILGLLKDKRILTVGDLEGFVQNGGIIRFFTKANKIHLRINLAAATKSNLTISSKVLRLSDVVDLGKD
jgi:hypothetical protein